MRMVSEAERDGVNAGRFFVKKVLSTALSMALIVLAIILVYGLH